MQIYTPGELSLTSVTVLYCTVLYCTVTDEQLKSDFFQFSQAHSPVSYYRILYPSKHTNMYN